MSALAPGDVPAIRAGLQQALELEHATIPPYLYAYYSIRPGSAGGGTVARILHSVLVEEMVHLATVVNVLNALGGEPVLRFHKYPGPLPGGVEKDLIVHLAPCSVQQVEKVFMVIEEPEDKQQFPVIEATADITEPVTIGQFYRALQAKIANLPAGAVTPRRQLASDTFSGIVLPQVSDTATAVAALDLIIGQGEGTDNASPQGPTGGGAEELAHYYRFRQIAEGGTLQYESRRGWVYDRSGPNAITLDPASVADAPTDPHAADYPAGTPARKAVDTFNRAYAAMLDALGKGLATGDGKFVGAAINQMFGLTQQAVSMMFPSPGAGTAPLGPTFEAPAS